MGFQNRFKNLGNYITLSCHQHFVKHFIQRAWVKLQCSLFKLGNKMFLFRSQVAQCDFLAFSFLLFLIRDWYRLRALGKERSFPIDVLFFFCRPNVKKRDTLNAKCATSWPTVLSNLYRRHITLPLCHGEINTSSVTGILLHKMKTITNMTCQKSVTT